MLLCGVVMYINSLSTRCQSGSATSPEHNAHWLRSYEHFDKKNTKK